MRNKLESLSEVMFKNFEKHEIGNLGQIVGGRKVTKSSSTGWYSNDKNGDNAWYPTKKEARHEE
jgi:hypothetical protein